MLKDRLDKILVEKGLVTTRSQAKSLIEKGDVYLGDRKLIKVSEEFSIDDLIEVRAPLYVGRGAFKLSSALDEFKLVVNDVWMDVGASTGGFTEVLLERGASKVYAVDVGQGQLAEKLKNDHRVINWEKTDVRELPELTEKLSGIVMDVSFISILKVLPCLSNRLKEKAPIVVLIKPQFEVGKEKLPKDGVIKDEKVRIEILDYLKKEISLLGFHLVSEMPSPIAGKSGNIEYLWHLIKD